MLDITKLMNKLDLTLELYILSMFLWYISANKCFRKINYTELSSKYFDTDKFKLNRELVIFLIHQKSISVSRLTPDCILILGDKHYTAISIMQTTVDCI